MPCWLIMPPDFGWCNLHIIHFWLVKSRINMDHQGSTRITGPSARHWDRSVRRCGSSRPCNISWWEFTARNAGRSRGKVAGKLIFMFRYVQTCLIHFYTFLMMFIDVQPFSLTSPIIGYGMAQNTPELPKNRWDTRHDSPGRPALLGLRATAPFRRRRAAWRQRVAANESAGWFVRWFVRWFVCWTSTASSQYVNRIPSEIEGLEGVNRRPEPGWMPPKCRSHAGRLPSEMLHGVHLGHLWPSVWVRKPQQIGNHLESHGVTIKNWDIYIYMYYESQPKAWAEYRYRRSEAKLI